MKNKIEKSKISLSLLTAVLLILFVGSSVETLAQSCATSFVAERTFSVNPGPHAVTAGDFNNDGKPDLATGSNANSVSVLLGDGEGAFAPARNFGTGTSYPYAITTDDFNGDGNLDLVAANVNNNSVTVLLGDGAGGFPTIRNIRVGGNPRDVKTSDFNGDGKRDIVTANYSASSFSILLGDGTGNFAPHRDFATGNAEPLTSHATVVMPGDFNSDNKPDVAVLTRNGGAKISLLLGDGTGNFTGQRNIFTGHSNGSGEDMQPGDFNADGKPDIALADGERGNVSILLGDGAGNLAPVRSFSAGISPFHIITGDFNRDGNLDVATSDQSTHLRESRSVSITLGDGTGRLAAPRVFNTGSNPVSLTASDFNRDGNLDVATANLEANTVSILIGDGAGGLRARSSFASYGSSYSITAGDINGDGKLDLVTANFDFSVFSGAIGSVSVIIGDGAGSFALPVNILTPDVPFDLTTGDFNGDGNLDLVTANGQVDTVSILLGNGSADGFTTRVNFPTGDGPAAIAANDFNKDGKLDLVTANNIAGNVSLLLGNGAGSFAAPRNFAAGAAPSAITVADFNNDGNLDLAVANETSDSLSVLLGDGAGSFAQAKNFSAADNPRSIVAGDFNKDGYLDLATANNISDNVSVLRGDGTGNFSSPGNFSVGDGPISISTNDFNGDGNLDLVTANNFSHNISLLLGNGAGGFLPAQQFGAGAKPNFIITNDFNQDGKFDVVTADTKIARVSVLLGTCPPAKNLLITKTNDTSDGICDADCSLREAIAGANPGDTIRFSSLFNSAQTITLTGGELLINKSLAISGPGANLLTVSGNNTSRVFNIAGNATVGLSGMTVTGGRTISDSSSGSGGGIANFGRLTVSNCHITNNNAFGPGGGIFNNISSTLTVTGSTVSNNTAGGGFSGAGGISSNGILTVTNSTVSGNVKNGSNSNAGGIFSQDTATITSSTVTDNDAAGASSAGGIKRVVGAMTIRNTIVAANRNNTTLPDVSGAFTSAGYNLIGNRGTATGITSTGDQSGTGTTPINPQLAPLANNGGSTPTHALLLSSPAIDKGNWFDLTLDQRGLTRSYDHTTIPNLTDGTDIGAFEARLAPTAASVSIGGRVLTPQNRGLVNARVTLTDASGNTRTSTTTAHGYFRFSDAQAGETYVLQVSSKKYAFTAQVISVTEDLFDLSFVANK